MKRSPLARHTPLARRTPLRPRSAKREALAIERRAFVATILSERPRCEFPTDGWNPVVRDGTGWTYSDGRRCTAAAVDVHEKLTRARGGDILDPSNVQSLCRLHHDYIHSHPRWATEQGYLVASWAAKNEEKP